MITTDKPAARAIASILKAHRVCDAVVSPGSRNAPLVVALHRAGMRMHKVVDERSAGFIALGIALSTGRPVATVCTSGSAVLDTAPAVAEAYYRGVPLIVVSADRPASKIDQNCPQTIRQHGVLANIVKRSYNLADNPSRSIIVDINDALVTATTAPAGPVHINVQLNIPLASMTGESDPFSEAGAITAVDAVYPAPEVLSALAGEFAAAPRVMILCGTGQPDATVREALANLAERPNVVVMAEPTSNLCSGRTIGCPDLAFRQAVSEPNNEELLPDLLITVGGSRVTSQPDIFLSKAPEEMQTWHVGHTHNLIDSFAHATRAIRLHPGIFFTAINKELKRTCAEDTVFKKRWHIIGQKALQTAADFLSEEARDAFPEPTAVGMVMQALPDDCNLQMSNGLSVRNAAIFPCARFHSIGCNRGVSGIDGCTSTAIGVAIADSDRMTVLLTGDMSASYDISALACNEIPTRFKMAVINNGGGGIFRKIESTSDLDERDKYFVCQPRLPLRELAAGYGFDYFCADSAHSLDRAFPGWLGSPRQAILEIIPKWK